MFMAADYVDGRGLNHRAFSVAPLCIFGRAWMREGDHLDPDANYYAMPVK